LLQRVREQHLIHINILRLTDIEDNGTHEGTAGTAISAWSFRPARCRITLGGPLFSSVAGLEERGRSGYMAVVRALLDALAIQPGESLLDVGCGLGVILRELAADGRRRSADRPRHEPLSAGRGAGTVIGQIQCFLDHPLRSTRRRSPLLPREFSSML
jgi:Mycolic acid cyclopropane synthetase